MMSSSWQIPAPVPEYDGFVKIYDFLMLLSQLALASLNVVQDVLARIWLQELPF